MRPRVAKGDDHGESVLERFSGFRAALASAALGGQVSEGVAEVGERRLEHL
jgi:hypothetical protein